MIIKDFQAKDKDGLYKLIISYKDENNRKMTEEQKEMLRENIALLQESPDTVTLTAVFDDKIKGYLNAHFIKFPLILGTECYISELIIHPDFRGRSAGRKLLEEIYKRAESRGAVRLLLNNHKNSESYERSFYLKNGFKEREDFANFVRSL